MTTTDPSPAPVVEGEAGPATGSETDEAVDVALVEEDLLVEDISIDGMCGVY